MVSMGVNMHKITITVKELAEALGIGINQAYALVKQDDFPKLKIGSKYVIPKDEFEAWVKTNSYGGKK